jgi:hypothetical protein
MSVVMAERIRLVILTDDELRSALRLEAAKRGVDMSEVADAILREGLAESLAEIRQRQKRKKGD